MNIFRDFKNDLALKSAYTFLAVILLIALTRVITVDKTRPQGFDEPAHVAAGMEWLQFHTYHLDTLHPPLARLAMAAPLYLSGLRFHETSSRLLPDFWSAGNSILYHGDYLRNLSLARFGMLPFLALMLLVLFLWTKRQFGPFAAVVAVVLTSTLPVVLTFATLAYTDLPAACLQLCCILAFAGWLEKPTWTFSAAFGLLLGLTALTKFTSLVYLPVAAAAILLCKYVLATRSGLDPVTRPKLTLKLMLIAVISLFVIWTGYRFSVGPINELVGVSQSQMPSFQHFPGPVRGLAREMIAADRRIPAPSFFAGLAQAWVMNKTTPDAYLFGKIKPGGWWYFFFIEALFKTPLPFLILLLAGCRPLYRTVSEKNWKALVPAIAALGIALFTTTVNVNLGLRHVLVLFPFLAIIAAVGVKELWELPQKVCLARALVLILLTWQSVAALRPAADWISYFNELAGRDPSKILVTGCDLDCGQDLLNLSDELRSRKVSHVGLALWTTADLEQLGFPQFDVLQPFQPTSGWLAISVRALREGSVQHSGYPPNAFSWLNRYNPVAHVGSTIWLYDIPVNPATLRTSATPPQS